MHMNDLEKARQDIALADRELAAAFGRRMAAARRAAAVKKELGLPVFDAQQENKVLELNSAYVEDEELRPYYLSLLREAIRLSRVYQQELMEKGE